MDVVIEMNVATRLSSFMLRADFCLQFSTVFINL